MSFRAFRRSQTRKRRQRAELISAFLDPPTSGKQLGKPYPCRKKPSGKSSPSKWKILNLAFVEACAAAGNIVMGRVQSVQGRSEGSSAAQKSGSVAPTLPEACLQENKRKTKENPQLEWNEDIKQGPGELEGRSANSEHSIVARGGGSEPNASSKHEAAWGAAKEDDVAAVPQVGRDSVEAEECGGAEGGPVDTVWAEPAVDERVQDLDAHLSVAETLVALGADEAGEDGGQAARGEPGVAGARRVIENGEGAGPGKQERETLVENGCRMGEGEEKPGANKSGTKFLLLNEVDYDARKQMSGTFAEDQVTVKGVLAEGLTLQEGLLRASECPSVRRMGGSERRAEALKWKTLEGLSGAQSGLDGILGVDSLLRTAQISGRNGEGGMKMLEKDLEEAMDGELEDILSGFERELMRLHPSAKRKGQELSLSPIQEEDDSDNGSQVESTPEEHLLQTLKGSVAALSARHDRAAAQMGSEQSQLSQLHHDLHRLAPEGQAKVRGRGDGDGDGDGEEQARNVEGQSASRVNDARELEEPGAYGEEQQKEGLRWTRAETSGDVAGRRDKMNRSASVPEVGSMCFRWGDSGSRSEAGQQIERLRQTVRQLEAESLEREPQLRRQREELSQLWRSAAELGKKAALERAKAAAEKSRAQRAEQALATSKESEAALIEKLRVAVQKTSQLKVALACLTDPEADAREKELEVQVATLQGQNGELRVRVSEAAARIAELEEETAELKKTNTALAAKVEWLAGTNKKRELEYPELPELVPQREATQVAQVWETAGLWALLEPQDVYLGGCSRDQELTDLRWACQAIQETLDRDAGSLESRPLFEEAETGAQPSSSVKGGAGDEAAAAASAECRSDSDNVGPNECMDLCTSNESPSFGEPRKSRNSNDGKGWGSSPLFLSPQSSLDKWESPSSTSSSVLGSPHRHPQVLGLS